MKATFGLTSCFEENWLHSNQCCSCRQGFLTTDGEREQKEGIKSPWETKPLCWRKGHSRTSMWLKGGGQWRGREGKAGSTKTHKHHLFCQWDIDFMWHLFLEIKWCFWYLVLSNTWRWPGTMWRNYFPQRNAVFLRFQVLFYGFLMYCLKPLIQYFLLLSLNFLLIFVSVEPKHEWCPCESR